MSMARYALVTVPSTMVERGEERSRAVALVVTGHGARAAELHRQAELSALERLDRGRLVDQHERMSPRIDVEADGLAQIHTNSGSGENLQ